MSMEVRILLFLVLVLMLPVSVRASDGYICSSEGTVLGYVRRNVDDGSVRWHHKMTIQSVTMRTDSSRTVLYESDFKKANGRQMYGGAVSLSSEVSAVGDVSMDMSQTLRSAFANIFPKMKITSEGGIARVPCRLTAGEPLPSVRAVARAAGVEYTMTVSDRRVEGRDTITTPAGTFPCTVVFEHKVEKTVGYNRETSSRTWYCIGVGMVRHDTYDKKMRLETTEILETITTK